MLKYLQNREILSQCGHEKRKCKELAAPRIPPVLKETEFNGLSSYDKVFAAAWLDHCSFVIGTKDNKLVRWDSSTNKRVEIPLPHRPWPQPSPPQAETCGIHSIAINREQTLLATGAANPCDTAVFSLPSFEPVSLLTGHEDWMFGTAWLTSTVVATGSRDKTLKLWTVHGDSFLNMKPIVTRTDHIDKIRDVKFHDATEKLSTLSHDGTCKIWDPHEMEVIRTVDLPEKRELVCLAMDHSLVAVGSQSYIAFVDIRCGHVKTFKSADGNWGVRSLSFKDNIVTCGGGKGKISFFDLRKEAYIKLRSAPKKLSHCQPIPPMSIELISYSTGKGTLDLNEVYESHFAGQSIHQAVYAHDWDMSGTKLLVAGGPLPFGLRGCYVAIW